MGFKGLKYYHYIIITCIVTLHNNPMKQPRILHFMCSLTILQSNGAKSQIKPCPTQFFTSSLFYLQKSTSTVDNIQYVQYQILYTIFPHIFLGFSTISFPSIYMLIIPPPLNAGFLLYCMWPIQCNVLDIRSRETQI